MSSPVVSRPGYGYGRPRLPLAESGLPGGGPSDRGLSLDDSIPGYSTFNKPVDDNDTGEQDHPDESIYRVRNPRDLRKDQGGRVDVVDQSHAQPGYMGLGKPHESPKTKYPYRDDKPNTHNADAEHVMGLWQLQTAPQRLLVGGLGVRVAAPLATFTQGLSPLIQQKAQSCSAQLKRADIKNLRWIFSVDCGNGAKVVRFKVIRKGNVTKFHKMDFHVACSCPAWRWQGPEYHSTTNDFQDPKTKLQGTATTPDIRDPDRVNKVCKHVAAVVSFTKEWTVPRPKKKKPKKKQARMTEQYNRLDKLMDDTMKALRAVDGWRIPKEGQRDGAARALSQASKKLHDALYIEFEDTEYGKRVKKKLRKVTNFKKMLTAYIKASSWDDLYETLSMQRTKTKNAFDKFLDYRRFILGFIAALDSETEDVVRIENYTVTLITSPRADWDRDRVARLTEMLKRTNKVLGSKGLSVVTGGRIFAYPGDGLPPAARTSHSAYASYHPGKDTIQLSTGDVAGGTHGLVHELGHRAYFRVVGGQGRTAWEQFFGDNVKPLNVDGMLRKWQSHIDSAPEGYEGRYTEFLGYYIGKVADADEKMWLQIVAKKLDIKEDFNRFTGQPKKGTKPGFEQLSERKDEVKAFLYPVTAYSGTSAEELFAETFSLYAIKGPGRIPEIVRHAFRQALPQFKGARMTQDYTRLDQLLEAVGTQLNFAVRFWWDGEQASDAVARKLAAAAKRAVAIMFFEFENTDYAKQVQKRLRRFNNFKKVLVALSNAKTADALTLVIDEYSTRSKDILEKFHEYRDHVLAAVAAYDVEVEETLSLDGFTVTLMTSPKGDWNAKTTAVLKEVLKRTNKTLASKGLSAVAGGRVFAYPGTGLPSSASGGHSAYALYQVKANVVRLAVGAGVHKVHLNLVHELGHRAYFKLLGGRGRTAWSQFFGDNVKPLNVDGMLRKWTGYIEEGGSGDLDEYLDETADSNEKMWLTVVADQLDIGNYDQLMTKKNEVEVFLYPVTAYSATSPEELFAETFAHYAVDGPGRIEPIVRHAFRQALPQFKGANKG